MPDLTFITSSRLNNKYSSSHQMKNSTYNFIDNQLSQISELTEEKLETLLYKQGVILNGLKDRQKLKAILNYLKSGLESPQNHFYYTLDPPEQGLFKLQRTTPHDLDYLKNSSSAGTQALSNELNLSYDSIETLLYNIWNIPWVVSKQNNTQQTENHKRFLKPSSLRTHSNPKRKFSWLSTHNFMTELQLPELNLLNKNLFPENQHPPFNSDIFVPLTSLHKETFFIPPFVSNYNFPHDYSSNYKRKLKKNNYYSSQQVKNKAFSPNSNESSLQQVYLVYPKSKSCTFLLDAVILIPPIGDDKHNAYRYLADQIAEICNLAVFSPSYNNVFNVQDQTKAYKSQLLYHFFNLCLYLSANYKLKSIALLGLGSGGGLISDISSIIFNYLQPSSFNLDIPKVKRFFSKRNPYLSSMFNQFLLDSSYVNIKDNLDSTSQSSNGFPDTNDFNISCPIFCNILIYPTKFQLKLHSRRLSSPTLCFIQNNYLPDEKFFDCFKHHHQLKVFPTSLTHIFQIENSTIDDLTRNLNLKAQTPSFNDINENTQDILLMTTSWIDLWLSHCNTDLNITT